MARLAAVPDRRASFREERRFAALSEPLLSQGWLHYRRPDYLKKVTEWPVQETLVVDGARLVITAGNDPPRVLDLDSHPEVHALIEAIRGPLAGDLGALQRIFDVQGSGTLANWVLELRPRFEGAASLLKQVRVSGQDNVIRELRLVQANGDEEWIQIGPA